MKSLWGQGERYLRIHRSPVEVRPGIARILLIGLIVLLAAVFIAGDVGLWNVWHAQKTLEVIEGDIGSLQSEISYLRRDINDLENDPFAIEKVAREKFGYMRPGERVYRIITLEPADKNGRGGRDFLDNRRTTP
jgi:cell division protein FtsB